MSTRTMMTVEQFFEMPEDELHRYELVQGELIEVGNTTFLHDWIRDLLLRRMATYVEAGKLGLVRWEPGVQINSNSYYVADGAFWDSAHLAQIEWRQRRNMVVPQLVLEVASPSNSFPGLLRKASDYQRVGVHTVWVVNDDPLEIHVFADKARFVLRAGEQLAAPQLLPGFSINASELIPPA